MATTAIESLRTFVERHAKIQFSHLCTAAIEGEDWAIERIAMAFEIWDKPSKHGASDTTPLLLETIRNTDITRPDGCVAKSMSVPR